MAWIRQGAPRRVEGEAELADDHRRLLDRVSEQAAAVIHNSIVFEQTQEDSLTDPLTGLANPRALRHHLEREIEAAERYGRALSVVVVDLDAEKAKAVAKEAGNGSICFGADVTDPAQVRAAFEKAVEVYGGVDIVVSNAGAAWQGRIGELDDATLRKSFELNFFAHQNVAQNAVRIFRMQKTGGVLLFNTSKQAVNPGPNFGAYGLPKAATLFLSRQYAIDYGAEGIRSNAVNADRIRSGLLTDEMIANRAKSRGVSEKDYMGGNLLGLEVRAEDVAQAFLHHALAERTTADVTTVDGGNIAAALR
jgi:NAD(P)-dependent dehydrogenase (short-subunit alcohol dehydrogenase family)